MTQQLGESEKICLRECRSTSEGRVLMVGPALMSSTGAASAKASVFSIMLSELIWLLLSFIWANAEQTSAPALTDANCSCFLTVCFLWEENVFPDDFTHCKYLSLNWWHLFWDFLPFIDFSVFFFFLCIYLRVSRTCMGERDLCVFHFDFIYIPGLLDHFRPINQTLREAHRTAAPAWSGHLQLQESWIKQTVMSSVSRWPICSHITIVVFLFFFSSERICH